MDRLIKLKGGAQAKVDAADYEALSGRKWHLLGGQYARSTMVDQSGKTRTVLMHRLIVGAQKGQLVDHINGDGLDNRRSNLRIATAAGNARNAAPRGSSGAVGVRRKGKKWLASIAPNGIEIFLGLWDEKSQAMGVYAAAASVLYGEFASRHAADPNHDLLSDVVARKREQVARLQIEIGLITGV